MYIEFFRRTRRRGLLLFLTEDNSVFRSRIKRKEKKKGEEEGGPGGLSMMIEI